MRALSKLGSSLEDGPLSKLGSTVEVRVHCQKLVSTVEIRATFKVRVAAKIPLRGQRVCRGSLEKVGLCKRDSSF